MYTMTYNSLLQDARRYLERGQTPESDPIVYEQLPRLATLAERRIARDLKILGFLRAMKTPLQAGLNTYLKPDRWRDTVSMTYGGKPLFARSYEFCRGYWPDSAGTDTPEFYADYDYQHWLIVPTPATVAELEVLYYEQPEFLSEENQANWLTSFAPDALTYATLLEATPFLKNDERIGTWQAMYDKAVGAISNEDMKRVMDRAAARSDA